MKKTEVRRGDRKSGKRGSIKKDSNLPNPALVQGEKYGGEVRAG